MGRYAGPRDVDASQLQLWLKQYGRFSKFLCKEMALFVEWLSNKLPPSAEIRAFMARRLQALDKLPGIRPLGCDKTRHRLFTKYLIHVSMSEAELVCGINQFCGGLSPGIEGEVHAMTTMWKLLKEEEELVFLLIDARNRFNEGNRTRMLWKIRHLLAHGGTLHLQLLPSSQNFISTICW